MGVCISKDLSYTVLRKSIVGALIPDSYFGRFYQLCRSETNTLSNTLRVNSLQSFYVVVSGEVVALVSDGQNDPVIAAVFRPGDIIYFFQARISCSSGAMTCGSSRLMFQFRSTDTVAQVIGTDRGSIDRFMDEYPDLEDFRKFFTIDLGSFMTLPGFKGLNIQQIHFLAPLMKLKRCREGQIIKLAGTEKEQALLQALATTQNKRRKALLRPMLADKSIGILLDGTCATTPPSSDISLLVHQISASSRKGFTDDDDGNSTQSHNLSNPQRMLSKIRRQSSHDHERNLSLSLMSSMGSIGGMGNNLGFINAVNMDGYDLILQDYEIYPGSIFGLEKIFIDKNNAMLDSIISVTVSIMGYFEWNAVKALFTADPNIKRALRRNFHQRIIDTVKPKVQLLSELDDKMYNTLCSKVMLRGFQPGEIVLNKGSQSNYSYIIVRGTVQETERDMNALHISSSMKSGVGEPRYLTMGSLIGEASLVTDSPYFSNITAVESTIAVCISKRTLDLVYNKDKAKLAELRIKLTGYDTELTHILMHPAGNRYFYEFLKKATAQENILFYNAVIKYEEMCERLFRACVSVSLDTWLSYFDIHKLAQKFNVTSNQTSTTLFLESVGELSKHSSMKKTSSHKDGLLAEEGRQPSNASTLQRHPSTTIKVPANALPGKSFLDQVQLANYTVNSHSGREDVPGDIGVKIEQILSGKIIADRAESASNGAHESIGEDDKIVQGKIDFGLNVSITNESKKSMTSSTVSVKSPKKTMRSASLEYEDGIIGGIVKLEEADSNYLFEHTHSHTSIIEDEIIQSKNPLSGDNKISSTAYPIENIDPSAPNHDANSQGSRVNGTIITSHTTTGSSATAQGSSSSAVTTNYIQQMEMKFNELKVVAGTLIEKYIRKDAECEVNISDRIRKEALEMYGKFSHCASKECLEMIIYHIYSQTQDPIHELEINDDSVVLHLPPHRLPPLVADNSAHILHGSSRPSSKPVPVLTKHQSYSRLGEEKADPGLTDRKELSFNFIHHLFVSSKNEIYKLMKNDNYPRYKKTPEFQSFISSLKPYEQSSPTHNTHNSQQSAYFPSTPSNHSPPMQRNKSRSIYSPDNADSNSSHNLNSMCLYVSQDEHSSLYSAPTGKVVRQQSTNFSARWRKFKASLPKREPGEEEQEKAVSSRIYPL